MALETYGFRCFVRALVVVLAAPAVSHAVETIDRCKSTPEHVWVELIGAPVGIATTGDEIYLRVHVPQPDRKLTSVQLVLDGAPALTIGAKQLAQVGSTNPLDIPITLQVEGRDPLKLQLESDSRIGVTAFAYDEQRNGASNCGYAAFGLRTGKITTYAVVVGFNYPERDWRLRWGQNDAESVVEHFIKKRRIPPQNIWLFTDDVQATQRFPGVNVNMTTTVETLRRTLLQISDNSDSAATLFFYFSGHQFVPDKNDLSFAAPKYVVLAQSDVEAEETMLPQIRLYTLLSQQHAKTISILDACFSGATDAAYNGPAPSAALGAKVAGRFYPYKDRQELPPLNRASRLASSSASKASWEFDPLKHGLFTFYMLEAGNTGQDISVQNAYKYAKAKTLGYKPVPAINGFEQLPDASFHEDSMDEIWAYGNPPP